MYLLHNHTKLLIDNFQRIFDKSWQKTEKKKRLEEYKIKWKQQQQEEQEQEQQQ